MLTLEKTRNIIPAEGGEPFAVHQHIITRNFWEYYLGETDEHGIAYGYVMGDYNEWGNVDVKEIKPYIISVARQDGTTDTLDDVMPPFGYYWENE
jgi:hypothetical protein